MKQILIFLFTFIFSFMGWSQSIPCKRVAITLDDGPSGALTEQFLALFTQHDVKVTFFQIGQKSVEQTGLCKQILEQGHEIGNHSWSHQRLTELDSISVRQEIEAFQSFCIDSLAYRPVSFRTPFLKQNAYIDSVIKNNQLATVKADIYARDAMAHLSHEVIIENLNKSIPDGSVILCHERQHTLEALKMLIPIWKEQNYEFVTIKKIIE